MEMSISDTLVNGTVYLDWMAAGISNVSQYQKLTDY